LVVSLSPSSFVRTRREERREEERRGEKRREEERRGEIYLAAPFRSFK